MKRDIIKQYRYPQIIGAIPQPDMLTALTTMAAKLIHNHNPALAVRKYESIIHPRYKAHIYITIVTSPNINHPYIVFADAKTDILNMVVPFGNDSLQSSLTEIPLILPDCSQLERYALYMSIYKSIMLRKKAIIEDDQFNLLKCANITNCKRKFDEIKRMNNLTRQQRDTLIKQYESYYQDKAIVFLKHYFDLLNKREYSEAFDFLKGNRVMKYKQRLNTFFKNTKAIIGHLQIFINLYQMGALISKDLIT